MKADWNFAVFDLETGGLSATKNPICEIAIVIVDSNLEIIEKYSEIIAPYDDSLKYEPKALEVNGLTMNQIENGKNSKEVVEEVISLFGEYTHGKGYQKKKPILVGHNIDKFDIPFIVEFFGKHRKDLSNFIEPNFTIDTMWWSRMKWIESVNYKLGTVCSNLGIKLENAHRALPDTVKTAEMFIEFMKSLRGESKENSNKLEFKRFREKFVFYEG